MTGKSAIVNMSMVMRMEGKLHLFWTYLVVNRICADNGAYMAYDQLIKEISYNTGRSERTAKVWVRNLLSHRFVYRDNQGNVIIKSKYKLAAYLCGGTATRRCFRVADIYNYQEFKTQLILAAHRYVEDGFYAQYYEVRKWLFSQGNLTAAEEWAFPSDRTKVGCGGRHLADRLGLSYWPVYNVLKGNVVKQWNNYFFSVKDFRKIFNGRGFFMRNPRYKFKRDKKGYLVQCQISSKSTFEGLFNVSRSRIDYEEYELDRAEFIPLS
ncbi:MAG TPA: hypothetical protein VK031_00490 [Tissierellaceae bacterium]|nr:hypothetical protein [Tissierellaceae bacterium]